MRSKIGLLVAAFLVAFSASAAHATWLATGDYWYYTDAPFGTIYCGGINSAVYTNSDVPSSNFIQVIVDAKSQKDLFCVNLSNAPAGYNNAKSTLVSSGYVLCDSTGWNPNPNNNSVARSWRYFNSTAASVPSYCRPGRDFQTLGDARVALNFADRYGSNSTGWAYQN